MSTFNVGDKVAVYTQDLLNIIDDGIIVWIQEETEEMNALYDVVLSEWNKLTVWEDVLEKLDKTIFEKLFTYVSPKELLLLVSIITLIISIAYFLVNEFDGWEAKKQQAKNALSEINRLQDSKIPYINTILTKKMEIEQNTKQIQEIEVKIQEKYDYINSLIQ